MIIEFCILFKRIFKARQGVTFSQMFSRHFKRVLADEFLLPYEFDCPLVNGLQLIQPALSTSLPIFQPAAGLQVLNPTLDDLVIFSCML